MKLLDCVAVTLMLVASSGAASLSKRVDEFAALGGEIVNSVPDCALTCMGTLVPEFCGTMTNVSCICTNPALAAALLPCVATPCNVTQLFSLQRFQATTCGIPDNNSRVVTQKTTAIAMACVSLVFVSARIFARTRLESGLGPDDWTMVAAEFVYLVNIFEGYMIAVQGFGRHTYFLSTYHISKAFQWFYVSEMVYLLTITLTKLSLLLFFRRIFPNNTFRMVLYVMGMFIILSNASMIMALTLQCIPLEAIWTKWMYKTTTAKCIKFDVAVFVAAAMSIIHDMLILVLPLPMLWRLNLSWQKKLNLMGMFSVGIFVLICSFLRLPTLRVLIQSSDPSYDQAPIAIWTNLESGVGIICGCLPACRALVGYIIPSLRLHSTAGSKTAGDYPTDHTGPSGSKIESRPRKTATNDFIELTGTGNSTEEGDHQHGRSSTSTMASAEPFAKSLNPDAPSKDMGLRTNVNVKDLEGGRSESFTASGIRVQTSVSQTNSRRPSSGEMY